ncbi:hypothetical protein FNV43_RR11317 [Rhamnella rubrinervis]|uniref:ubiquitinyl hydrolase 1 n=1 Tax=Rhamnella rubrinervis TaxID=2594499 RepID=A0A8K0MHR5_9ROSA|nr:hypothetical protein FNV43_RR11317 [Rhamnella rubrinervis]
MHVAGVTLDLNWFLQFIFTVFIIAVGLLHLLKNTASKYFEVDANFEGGGDHTDRTAMPGVLMDDLACVVCGNSGGRRCSRCKAVRYCSTKCQEVHWNSGHKTQCKVAQLPGKENSAQITLRSNFKTPGVGRNTFSELALIPERGTSKLIKQPKEILFPYDEFVKLFNWDKPGFPPCGLLNCGNSCFANVVLQCLTFTRPLVAYLLEKGHRRECIRNEWCFLCEFQNHLERASKSLQPFSPTNIISRLPNIGGNLGYGRQEDAHEFMRFAIDTMQSVCLDEFGGEKAVPASPQETTIIQHIFGGHLQSQVICTTCNNVSNQYENMMDLTVEIHGDAASLEECLDQFTGEEWLHGENMYKCDGCNDYVKASKRLTVKLAPNILTIALKRFQSGRFGKLNKRVTFPETLDLSPYMSEAADGLDIYKLYAVVVHVDMLNASFFGHYICYTKDFRGNWYKIDDYKVTSVELEDVLSQGAYMLLYSRDRARPSCLRAPESLRKEQRMVSVELVEPCLKKQVECFAHGESGGPICSSSTLLSGSCLCPEVYEKESSAEMKSEDVKEHFRDTDMGIPESTSVLKEVSSCKREVRFGRKSEAFRQDGEEHTNSSKAGSSVTNSSEKVSSIAVNVDTVREDITERDMACNQTCQSVLEKEEVSLCCKKDFSVSRSEDNKEESYSIEDSGNMDMVESESTPSVTKDVEIHSNGHIPAADETDTQVEYAFQLDSGTSLLSEASEAEHHKSSKRMLPPHTSDFQDGNGVKRIEIMGNNSL